MDQTQNTGNQQPKRRDARWADIYMKLQEDKVEYFLSTQLEPTVLIPSDGFQTEWPVDSQRFQDLLISLFYEISDGQILRVNDREFLMAQIREECRKGGRRLTEAEAEETDEDVIVQTIVILMNQESSFADQTAELSKKLKAIRKANSLPDSIPTFTNIFSRKLNRLIPVLRGYGVEVVMEHRESGSHCTLTQMESFQKEPVPGEVVNKGPKTPPGGSTGTNTQPGQSLPIPDSGDGAQRTDPPKVATGANDEKVAPAKKGGAK